MHTWSIEYAGFWIIILALLGLAIFVFTFLVGIGVISIGENNKKKLNVRALLLSVSTVAALCFLVTANLASLNENRRESLSTWLDVNYEVTVDDKTLEAIIQNALDYDENTHPYVFETKVDGSSKPVKVTLYEIDEEFTLIKYSAVQYVQQK